MYFLRFFCLFHSIFLPRFSALCDTPQLCCFSRFVLTIFVLLCSLQAFYTPAIWLWRIPFSPIRRCFFSAALAERSTTVQTEKAHSLRCALEETLIKGQCARYPLMICFFNYAQCVCLHRRLIVTNLETLSREIAKRSMSALLNVRATEKHSESGSFDNVLRFKCDDFEFWFCIILHITDPPPQNTCTTII